MSPYVQQHLARDNPGHISEVAHLWSAASNMKLMKWSDIILGKDIPLLSPQKNPLSHGFYRFLALHPTCLTCGHGFIVEVWPVQSARLGLRISHWKRPKKPSNQNFQTTHKLQVLPPSFAGCCQILGIAKQCTGLIDSSNVLSFWLPSTNPFLSLLQFLFTLFFQTVK